MAESNDALFTAKVTHDASEQTVTLPDNITKVIITNEDATTLTTTTAGSATVYMPAGSVIELETPDLAGRNLYFIGVNTKVTGVIAVKRSIY